MHARPGRNMPAMTAEALKSAPCSAGISWHVADRSPPTGANGLVDPATDLKGRDRSVRIDFSPRSSGKLRQPVDELEILKFQMSQHTLNLLLSGICEQTRFSMLQGRSFMLVRLRMLLLTWHSSEANVKPPKLQRTVSGGLCWKQVLTACSAQQGFQPRTVGNKVLYS